MIVCFVGMWETIKWSLFLDNVCFRHIIGNKEKFISLTTINGRKVTFEDNAKGKVVSKDKVGRLPNCFIDYVLLVKALKHKLLSISQFYDKGNQVIFNITQCLMID